MTITTPVKFSLASLAFGLLVCALARAEEPATQPAPDEWRFTVGLGAASLPRYPGSAERKTTGFPVLSASRGRYFIGGVPGAGVPAGIGAYLVQDDRWHMGVGVGGELDKPRRESDSRHLQGLGDIDATAIAAVFARYNEKWWSFRGNALTDVGGKQQGTRLSIGAEARLPIGETASVSAGSGLTWADARHTQKFFGVNAEQSARSGLAVRTANSGLNSIEVSLNADVRLSAQSGVGLFISVSRLCGDAADSPVTQKVMQTRAGLFAAHSF